MSTGKRYRMIEIQDGKEHISSVVLTYEEAVESLRAEAELHFAAGWIVVHTPEVVRAVSRKSGVIREITFRSFEPLGDVLSSRRG